MIGENRDIWEYAAPVFPYVLTLLWQQNRYCGYGGSQLYYYGRCAMLTLNFGAPKFRLRRVQEKYKKEQKIKNCVQQQILFYFSVFTSWKQFWGLILVDFLLPVKVRNFGNFVLSFYRPFQDLWKLRYGDFSWRAFFE